MALESGLQSVMSAHIAFPEISEHEGLPGTLDPSILNRILIDSLNFDGLIVTDGLEMKGITEHFSPGDAVIRALQAGADMMLVSTDEITAINDIKKAVQSGRLSEERIDYSVQKILTLKKRYGTSRFLIDLRTLGYSINTPQFQSTADRIARESVTHLKNSEVLPIREAEAPDLLVLGISDGERHSGLNTLAGELRKYHSGIHVHSLDSRTGLEEIYSIEENLERADLVILASFLRSHSLESSSIPEAQLGLISKIMHLDLDEIVISFGSPYILSDFKETSAHMLAWSADRHQITESVPSLFAASDVGGSLPAEIPGLYKIGDGLNVSQSAIRFDNPADAGMRVDSLLKIDGIMQEAINDSVFPGGVVGVMRNGVLAWQQAYGYHDYTKTKPVRADHVFDMASITKIMATTTAIMKLVDENKLSLDDPVYRYIPEFDTDDKREITIKHFMLHTSGLPAFRIYVDSIRTRQEIIDAVRNEPLINKPGEEYVYSDLGFILLAEIIEKVSGKRIDEFMRDEFFNPMDMNSTTFNPLQKGVAFTERIPPTEIDTVYDRGLVHKKVHDERAYYMDGISGHAGLFSSVQDMSRYFFMLLNDGVYAGRSYLKPETIDLFTTKQSPLNQRGLGFDRKSEGFSTAGTMTSEQSYGHTGFTGTSFWVDPNENIAIIVLTNRTFPNRSYGQRISRIRAAVADAVMKSIQY